MSRRTANIPEEVRLRAERSRQEAMDLVERSLICPECGFRIASAFTSLSGLLKLKCPKCKVESVLNLAFYRRQRKRQRLMYRHTYSSPYKTRRIKYLRQRSC